MNYAPSIDALRRECTTLREDIRNLRDELRRLREYVDDRLQDVSYLKSEIEDE